MARPPKMQQCACGQSVACKGFTNTCGGCGTQYNMSGQLLADPSQWGEETGETASDIHNAEAAGFPDFK